MEVKIVNSIDDSLVKLLQFVGGDDVVIDTAQISYDKRREMNEEEKFNFVYNLAKKGHETPFEQTFFTFDVEAPIFVARQWFRHRLMSFNERSGRYTILNSFYLPEFRYSGKDKKSAYEIQENYILYKSVCENAFNAYEHLLSEGVHKELARTLLPLSTMTSFRFSANVRSLVNFLTLRLAPDAQYEIRTYARIIAEHFENKCPHSFKAFRMVKKW